MKVPFVDLKAQYQAIKHEIDTAITAVISETAFIKGKYVEAFEKEFATWVGRPDCIGVANGTDALEIALQALGIGEGDEVIVPANSFIATSEAVSSSGAKVVFVEHDAATYTIDVSKIESKITSKTRAIIPVHLYGLPAEMDEILALAKKHNLKIIEDCAQAHGAEYKGKRIGTFGDVACFSFFPGKNLGAYGDAGAIVVSDAELATKCRMIANHGRIGKYDHEFEGRNSRLDGLQAAILSVKLKYIDQWNAARRKHAEIYSKELGKFVSALPQIPSYSTSVYHLYVVQVKEREALQKFLKEKGIETGVHYPIPLPLLKAYEYLGHKASDFPIAAAQASSILSLPMFPELSETQINYVIESMAEFQKLK